MSAGYGIGRAVNQHDLPTAGGERRVPRVRAHARERQKTEQNEMDQRDEQPLERGVRLLVREAADERRAVRQQRSRPLVEAMKAWLTEILDRISGRSALAQAIRYALNHWSGLVLFLDDGRLELDTNAVERAMRPVALGRKNALFAGADSGGEHWALIATLIQTAKLNKLDPLAWLTDVLERIVSGQTKRNELHTLLPWNWKPACTPATISSA